MRRMLLMLLILVLHCNTPRILEISYYTPAETANFKKIMKKYPNSVYAENGCVQLVDTLQAKLKSTIVDYQVGSKIQKCIYTKTNTCCKINGCARITKVQFNYSQGRIIYDTDEALELAVHDNCEYKDLVINDILKIKESRLANSSNR